MQPEEWQLEFYVDSRGHSPVTEFLDTLDNKTRARFRWSMEPLESRWVMLRELRRRPVI